MSHSSPDGASGDHAVAEALRRHHAQLADGLDRRTESLLRLVDNEYLIKAKRARQDLLA